MVDQPQREMDGLVVQRWGHGRQKMAFCADIRTQGATTMTRATSLNSVNK